MTVETTTIETTTKNLLAMATQMSLRAQFEQVKKEILVPLDQSLRIDLPMLELLVSVPLDPLQESSQGHLLLSPQSGLLLLNYCLYLLFLAVSFFLLFEIALHVELFGLFVALGVHQLLDLLPHVHELLGKSDLRGLLFANLLVQLLDLKKVLLLQFLVAEEGLLCL